MNRITHRLAARDVLHGCFAQLADPVWVEMLIETGFDFVVIDCEEGPGDSYGPQLEAQVRAAHAAGGGACVRVVENVPGAIGRALAAGADGLWIPHVRNGTEARAVVDAARHAPLGRRPASPTTRARRYGFDEGPVDEPLIFLLVEDTEGISNIDEIVSVEGIDGVMVGTWDLSVEMGLAGYGATAPEVMAHVDRVIAAGQAAGLHTAGHAWSGEAATKYVEMGCQILFVSIDTRLVLAGLTEMAELASRLETR